jgi:predicted SprT family Zn-dependent metalloprotease
MPLLRQLEFAFQTTAVAGIADPGAAITDRGYSDVDLETTARQLLRALGAGRIARELRVEWNPRLQTAAGRADYREKLISLNPRLRENGEEEIDRTLRHELAHLLAQFRAGRRRVAPHGPEWREACRDLGIADEARCHNLPFAARIFPPRFVYRCPNCKAEFPRVRRVRRAVACLACCRKHNGGEFDARFRLRLVVMSSEVETALTVRERSEDRNQQ